MASNKPPERRPRDSDPEIAAADFLFGDHPPEEPRRGTSQPHMPTTGAGDVFDLAEAPDLDQVPPAKGVPAPEPTGARTKAAAPKGAPGKPAEDDSALDPATLVEEVWSRMAEWGPNLIVVGGWVALFLLAAYLALGAEQYGIAFMTLVVGSVAAVVLAYPILITLERPVRMTPEQAVRDFYHALSHHVPHFRRMWLLLSAHGRVSTAFGSFDGFKAYWKNRLAQLRGNQAGALTPLVFEVVDFKADKSAGRVRIDSEFAVKVSIRGQRQSGPVHVVPVKIALVRGPDRMWYLEDGTLPQEVRAAKAPHS